MAELGPVGAVVFQALWVSADDGGMAPCDPGRLKGEMFFGWAAVEGPEITGALRELHALGRVKFYQGGDELFCRIVNWRRHQFVHKPSKFRWSELYAKQGKRFAEVVPEWCGTSAAPVGEQGRTPPFLDSKTPRLLDSKTPRLQESQNHRDAARRADDSPSEEPTPKSRAARATWLTPYWDAWVSAYGGKPPAGQLAKHMKPLHDEHGLEQTLAHWRNYLASTEARFASPARFAQTFGSWAAPQIPGLPPGVKPDDRVYDDDGQPTAAGRAAGL
jgi:hypothetical protein